MKRNLFCWKYLFFFGIFLKKILLTVFFVIGFKAGNSPGMGENVKDVKLGFWAMEKE
jgi:hypothetical protein